MCWNWGSSIYKEWSRENNKVQSSYKINAHDFRIVGHGEHQSIIFDVVVDNDKMVKIMTEDELKEDIINAIKDVHPEYNCIITIDRDYH